MWRTTREGWTQSRRWEQWMPSLALPYVVHTPSWLPIRWKTSQQARDNWVSTQEPSARIKLSPASLYSLGFEWRHYFASFCQLCLLACRTGYVTCRAQRKNENLRWTCTETTNSCKVKQQSWAEALCSIGYRLTKLAQGTDCKHRFPLHLTLSLAGICWGLI